MILKYQLATEELDALVSVKSEEDLHHMIDEMEHYQMMGCPRMRTFLFPIINSHHHHHQILIDNNIEHHQLPLDQRYIFSINGISPSPSASAKHHHHLTLATKHLGLGSVPSSACTSPRSPNAAEAAAFNSEHQNIGNTTSMHKIQSSPSICNLNNINIQPQHYSHHHPPPHHYYHHAHRSPNPPYNTHNTRTAAALVSIRSGGRFQPDSTPPSYNYYAPTGTAGYCTKCMHHDNCSHFLDTRSFDRQGTLP